MLPSIHIWIINFDQLCECSTNQGNYLRKGHNNLRFSWHNTSENITVSQVSSLWATQALKGMKTEWFTGLRKHFTLMSKNIMSWQALILIYSSKEDLNTIYRQMYSAATQCVGEWYRPKISHILGLLFVGRSVINNSREEQTPLQQWSHSLSCQYKDKTVNL